MSNQFLETPISYLKGCSPAKADLLKLELRIFNYADLLSYYPFRYVDKTKFYKINQIKEDLPFVQIKGKITKKEIVGNARQKRLIAIFQDETGSIELVWFQGHKWIADTIKIDTEYIIFGKANKFKNSFSIPHPELDLASEIKSELASSMQPIYSSTDKLKAKWLDSKGISKLTKALLLQASAEHIHFPETLSENLIQKLKLVSKDVAIKNIHLPENAEMLTKSEFRLKFEELFFIQIKILRQKINRHQIYNGFVFSNIGEHFNTFYKNNLPFELTNAQKKVLKEIRKDVGSGKQMNRLLQGDVGSGKTVVALMTMLMALDNGFQCCLMTPTEILANQHFQTISKLLNGMNLKVGLLTGSSKSKARKLLHQELESGEMSILIGTHALLEDVVKFKNLGLVVIDEQHRFGVAQRAMLWKKAAPPLSSPQKGGELVENAAQISSLSGRSGGVPHILVMTATPIPRTLAMTLYGDLDVSVIDELPAGRKPIQTFHRFEPKRQDVYNFIKTQIQQGRQVYIVYPLIKESETLDYQNLMEGYNNIIKEFPQPDYKVGILHGQMKSEEKDLAMQKFINKETPILVATTVIEVGVDVPNASVMVVESAERFGLSQLHQLRGRVGRGADQSYCILLSSFALSEDGKKRLETMVRTNDGFEIANVDMRLRGPGDFEGTQQSGILDLKIADLVRDTQILQYASDLAIELLQDDPHLRKPENTGISNQLKLSQKNKENWSKIS